ncbi:MAG: T9SS type A sorting domain-containing protein [Bacteroidales bacterium]|nr:T9SS type A sorting domain-containing protein [Bacteroidales bacterium]
MKKFLSLMLTLTLCATVYAQAPWKTNILTNGSVESGSFDGWTKTTNGGSGWAIGGGPEGTRTFVSSYSNCVLTQDIDLEAKGFSATELDGGCKAMLQGYCAGGVSGNSKGIMKMIVYLLDANKDVLQTVSLVDLTFTTAPDWAGYDAQTVLPEGTRYVRYQITGKDTKFWAGQYGPRFTGMAVRLCKSNEEFTFAVTNGMYSNGLLKWMGTTEMDPNGGSSSIEAAPGASVYLTVTPNVGCEFLRCSVKYALGTVPVTENGTTISFTMPTSDVVITPTFEKTEVPSLSDDGYYNIYNANTLKWLANQVNIKGNNTIKARLMNDIDMAGKPFSPIGLGTVLDYNVATLTQKGFAGIFDGQGYAIRNLTIGAASGEVVTGFIGNLSGTIKNIVFDNCSYDQVNQDVRMGIIAGVVQPDAVVENCAVINSTINVAGHIGAAVAGANYGGTIRYCYTFNNTLQAHGRAGYLVGDNTNDGSSLIGTITDCISDNKIEGTTSDAHIGTITNCTTNSTLKLDDGSLAYAMYALNTVWRQELGVDAFPRPNGNGPRVYQAQCASNKYSNNSLVEHGHVYGADGICSICGAVGCPQVNGVFQIATKADLDFFSDYVNTSNPSAKAVLVADIVYNDDLLNKITIDSVNVATVNEEGTVYTWQPIANINNFTGSFDGQGHSITGLYINEGSPAGLFAQIGSGSTIENVIIKDSYIRGTICGGIAAKADGSTITNCAVENSYVVGSAIRGTGGMVGNSASENTVIQHCYNTSTIYSSTYDVGGILGYGFATINNCYNQGSAHGGDDTGGIVGDFRGGSATNCYNSGNITCVTSYVGSIVGYNPSTTISNCYSVITTKVGTQKSVEEFASGEVTYLLNNGQDGDVWFQEIGTDAFPHFNETGENKVYLSNTTYTNTPTDDFLYGGGTGSKNYPFIIQTRAHLEKLANKVNSGITYSGYYFLVANDIDLTTDPWTPIGRFTSATDIKPFSGCFDGGNHVIDHLTIQSTQLGAAGFFAMVLGGELRNIILTNVNIERPINADAFSFAGAVVARANFAIVENCEARSGSIITGSSNVNGGVAGAFAGGTMRNCINRLDITSSTGANTSHNGGIVGRIEPGTEWRGYTNPYASSRGNSYIQDCRNYGNITSSGSYLGGIAGTFTNDFTSSYKGYVERCANAGTITGNGACGGIVGELTTYGEVNYNVNIGSIRNYSTTSTTYRYGGIVGSVSINNTGIYGNLNAGNVTTYSTQETGGIVGCVGYASQEYYYNAVQRNLNVAAVSSNGTYVGTLVGRNSRSKQIGGGITNSQVKLHPNCGSDSDAVTSSSAWGWGGFVELPTVAIAGLRQRGSSQLGNQDVYFHFEEGRYPCPKGIEMSDIVRVATTPIYLKEDEIYNTAGTKSTSFEYNTDVEFSTKNGYINFEDGTATYEGAGEEVIYITYGDAQRYLDVVIAWNKARKLTVSSAQDLEVLATGVNAGSANGFSYHGTTLPRYAEGCAFVQTCDIKRGVHTPIGTTTNAFRGTYDGGGHSITGLICNTPNSLGVGLFGAACDGVVIKNLSIDGAIIASHTAAGFVGFTNSGSLTIENCSNSVNVETRSDNHSGAAAFVGNAGNTNVTIRNCYNSAQISSSADGYLAAIANKPDEATGVLVIENVHNYGTIAGVLKTDGNAFANNATKMTNCYINITRTATLNTVATGLTRATETDFNNGKVCWMLNGMKETRGQCEDVLFTQNLDPQTGELWPVFNSLYVYPKGTDAFTNIRPDGEYTLSEYIVYDITNFPKDTLFPAANLLTFAAENATWTFNQTEYLQVDSITNGYAYVTSKTDVEHAGWMGAEVITFSTTVEDAEGTAIQIDVPIKYEKKFISPDASTELKVTLVTPRTIGTPYDLFRVRATVIGRRDEGLIWSLVKAGTSEKYTNVILSQTTLEQDFKIPDVGEYTLIFAATSTDEVNGVKSFPDSKNLSVIGIKDRAPQVCYGESILLETYAPGFSCTWSNGIISDVITVNPTETTKYVVEMDNGVSKFIDSVTVIVSKPVSTTPNSCLHVGNTMEIEAIGNYETYSWSTGETTSKISVSEPGTYIVETLDALGCTSKDSTEISVYGITTTDLAICYGEGITLNAAASMDSIIWNDAFATHGETVTINYLYETQSVSATSYKNGVPYLDAVTVVVGEPVSFNDVRAICSGVTTTISAVADYATYSWDNGEGTDVISTQKSIVVNEPNTYRLTAIDALGCESSRSIMLNVVPNPVVNLGEDRSICYGDTIVLDAGAGFMKYNWSATRDFETAEIEQTFIADTILLQTIQGLGNERKLSVEVQDKFGCSNSDTVVLTFRSRPTITFGEGGLYCGEKESVAPTFTVSGVAPFRFTYTDGVEQFTEDFRGKTFTPAAPGIGEYTYRMNALEDAYCSADTTSQTTVVKVIPLPTVELGADTTLCYGESLALNVHNDGAIYSWLPLRDGVHAELKDSYIVDTAVVNHNFPISNVQEIVATVTSAEGCVVKDTVVVTFKERPTVSITGSTTYCGLDNAQGATFNLKGTAPFTFTYTDGEETTNVDSLETASLQAQKPTAIGVYDYSILSLKDATCTADLQVSKARVVVAEIPEVVLGNDTTLCYGEELTLQLNAEEGASYVWSPRRDGIHITTSTSFLVDTAIVNNNIPISKVQEIVATKTTSNGCFASDTMIVTFIERPSATISGGATYCGTEGVEGATISLKGTAPFTFAYTDGIDTTYIESQEEAMLQTEAPSSVGLYNYSIVSLKDAYCSADYQSSKAKVVVAEIPTVSLGNDTTLCYGESIVLNAGAEAKWYANGNYVSRSSSMEVDTALIYGYSPNKNEQEIVAVVTNAEGCSASDTMMVTFKDRPSATISGGATYCGTEGVEGATISLKGTAPFTFAYTDGIDTTYIESQEEATLQTEAPSSVGLYNYSIVSLQDAYCSSNRQTAKARIVVSDIPIVTIGTDTTLCYGEALVLNAGNADSYEWKSNGAIIGTTSSLTVDENLVFNYWPIVNNKEITVTIANENGCTNSDTLAVTFRSRPTATVSSSKVYCGNEEIVQPASFLFDGVAPFTFTYNNGEQSFTETVEEKEFVLDLPQSEGVYSYRLTSLGDAECSETAYGLATSITIAAKPSVNLGEDQVLCSGELAYLDAQTEEDNSCVWFRQSKRNPISVNSSIVFGETDTVTVMVTSPYGCKAYDTVSITIKKPYAEQLGIVTYSENATDMIIAWEKTVDVGTVGYIVERETDYTNNWVAVDDTVFFGQPALVVDYNVPATRSYKYRLRTIDECGNTAVSKPHRSMHLSIRKQIDEKPSLNWNAYEPMELVSQYLVLRGSDPTAMDTIDRVPASNMTETWDELESFEGKMYYKVLFVLENEVNELCYHDIHGNKVDGATIKAESGPFSLAISNVAEAENAEETTAVEDVENAVVVYAVDHTINVKNAIDKAITIYDNTGRVISHTSSADEAIQSFDVRLQGVYFVKVEEQSFTVIVK